jgi:hypothetical protein
MLADQFLAAAAAASSTRATDELAAKLWKAHGEGCLADAEASAVIEAIEGHRRAFAAGQGFRRPSLPKAVSGPPRAARKHPRSPDRQASLERRRRQATSGAMPPALAAHFTTGELAALSVVAREVQRHGACVLCVDAIAGLAGVCRRTVQNALGQARRLGLILVRERRIPRQKSLTNVVRVVSPEWTGWLKLSGRATGCKNLRPTDTVFSSKGAKGEVRASNKGGTRESIHKLALQRLAGGPLGS